MVTHPEAASVCRELLSVDAKHCRSASESADAAKLGFLAQRFTSAAEAAKIFEDIVSVNRFSPHGTVLKVQTVVTTKTNCCAYFEPGYLICYYSGLLGFLTTLNYLRTSSVH